MGLNAPVRLNGLNISREVTFREATRFVYNVSRFVGWGSLACLLLSPVPSTVFFSSGVTVDSNVFSVRKVMAANGVVGTLQNDVVLSSHTVHIIKVNGVRAHSVVRRPVHYTTGVAQHPADDCSRDVARVKYVITYSAPHAVDFDLNTPGTVSSAVYQPHSIALTLWGLGVSQDPLSAGTTHVTAWVSECQVAIFTVVRDHVSLVSRVHAGIHTGKDGGISTLHLSGLQ